MSDITHELPHFYEDYDVEAKAAQGRGGEGEVPQSVWSTYSAMANSDGGYIYLGVGQKKSRFTVLGIQNVEKVLKSFWDSINDSHVVNRNILTNADVTVAPKEGKSILIIHVPRATRQQRPIFVGQNPFTGTYRRNYEGDYPCDEATVGRMMAEATEDSRDARLLSNFDFADLDLDSLSLYRNLFRSTKPNHPWLAHDDQELLRSLGGWVQNRETKEEGLSVAGLLMFGKLRSILDAFPHYVVDYQLQPSEKGEQRWLDRLTTDGTWSGNLFDFYRRTYAKLTDDLKVPFRMERGQQRVDESHVHEALREALVNSLIHADFSGRLGLLVIRRPTLFGFRNPGNLRLPLGVVMAGGQSDCRNRNLQKMFQMIGLSEQAGSGIPKILRAWQEQHWRLPLLKDENDPEQTVLRLPMVSLLPPDSVDALRQMFGERFDLLGDQERLAIVTAHVEGKVTNERLRTMTSIHSRDCSNLFRSLVDRGLLETDGVGRWTSYHISSTATANEHSEATRATVAVRQSNSDISEGNSDISEGNSDISELPSEEAQRLIAIANPVRAKKRATREEIRSVIIELCAGAFRTPKLLSALLDRTPDNLRQSHLTDMVRENLLEYLYGQQINHPNQAYRTKWVEAGHGTETQSNGEQATLFSSNNDL